MSCPVGSSRNTLSPFTSIRPSRRIPSKNSWRGDTPTTQALQNPDSSRAMAMGGRGLYQCERPSPHLFPMGIMRRPGRAWRRHATPFLQTQPGQAHLPAGHLESASASVKITTRLPDGARRYAPGLAEVQDQRTISGVEQHPHATDLLGTSGSDDAGRIAVKH